ncbi:hypothetical protein [Yersinia aleksiciae]|uniref:hypothetical protein n=1 Tax=Yersinia aleksiciae TaxID=263819 RepID=UPI0005DD97EC|nr:hypothetical protein [Yersinia aleksiciae]CNI65121.1 Uncharacterised protein [Yersinia frederiksenii]
MSNTVKNVVALNRSLSRYANGWLVYPLLWIIGLAIVAWGINSGKPFFVNSWGEWRIMVIAAVASHAFIFLMLRNVDNAYVYFSEVCMTVILCILAISLPVWGIVIFVRFSFFLPSLDLLLFGITMSLIIPLAWAARIGGSE